MHWSVGKERMTPKRTAHRRNPSGPVRQGRCQMWSGPPSTLHGRNHEFSTFLGTCRPARSDSLCFGVKADRIRPVLVQVAEAGAFPAAKRVISQRHGNRKIDAHHADLHTVDEIACGIAVASENRNTV